MAFELHTANGLRPWVRSLARALLAAMLLATLAPAISRTLAASHEAGDWVEICAGTGMRWVQVGDDGSLPKGSEGLRQALDRCGHCTLAADRFAPLLPALPSLVGDSGPSPVPQHASPVARAAGVPSPSARGPPFLN